MELHTSKQTIVLCVYGEAYPSAGPHNQNDPLPKTELHTRTSPLVSLCGDVKECTKRSFDVTKRVQIAFRARSQTVWQRLAALFLVTDKMALINM